MTKTIQYSLKVITVLSMCVFTSRDFYWQSFIECEFM